MAVQVVEASQRCPRCGSTLITNGRNVWCTYIGGRDERPCVYGIDEPVRLVPESVPGSGTRGASRGALGFDGAGI